MPLEVTRMPKLSDVLSATTYFKQLAELLTAMRVTDKSGNQVPMEEGLERALEKIAEVKSANKKVMIVGNGGSAAIASHQVIDFWKTCGIQACTFNDPIQLTCLSNDFGYENVFSKAIEMFGNEGDLLLAISSGGKSPNILNAAHAARNKSAAVITLAGFSAKAPLLLLGDLNFYIDSNQYGFVEVAHLAIIHYLTDTIAQRLKDANGQSSSASTRPEDLAKKLFGQIQSKQGS